MKNMHLWVNEIDAIFKINLAYLDIFDPRIDVLPRLIY